MSEPMNADDFDALVRQHRRVGEPTSAQPRRQTQADALMDEAEYHQARVLLLIWVVAGRTGKLDGLTKLAKLDFLLRYPVLLDLVLERTGESRPPEIGPSDSEAHAVESRMVRYKYGPWDDRYYGIIGALVGRGLVEYVESKGRVALRTTDGGAAVARGLSTLDQWRLTALRCQFLKDQFGTYSGNRLKDLIYSTLPEAVDLPHRTEI
jgi:hypothetical protein